MDAAKIEHKFLYCEGDCCVQYNEYQVWICSDVCWKWCEEEDVMPQDAQPEFEWPAILRLPQVPPLKVPARRQTQFIAPPAPVRYTEQVQVPVTPSLAPENDPFRPVPVTPPLTYQPQWRMRAPEPVNIGGITVTGRPIRSYIPTGRRSRDVGNGEFLLGCAFLFFMALLALGLLTWLSVAR